MKNLARALAQFDLVAVYDNARRAGLDDAPDSLKPRLVLECGNGSITYTAPDAPPWLRSALSGTSFQLK